MIMSGVIQIRIANGDDQQQVSDRMDVSQRMVLVHLPAWITRG
jgi:DNA-binding CsgD family transcriptional regulator